MALALGIFLHRLIALQVYRAVFATPALHQAIAQGFRGCF